MKKLLLLVPVLGSLLAVPLLTLLPLAGTSSVALACGQPSAMSSARSLLSASVGSAGRAGRPVAATASADPGEGQHATGAARAVPSAAALPVAACQQLSTPSGDLAKRALAWALAHVGDAYVAAAQGPHAWDCSTFTYTAYRQAGLDWPMQISYQQYLDRRHVQLIPLSQAQPGDLLFFDTGQGNSWFNPVTHVAMIVDPGPGTMVNAANPSAGVIISNYETSSYYRAQPPVAAPDLHGIPRAGGGSVAGRILDA